MFDILAPTRSRDGPPKPDNSEWGTPQHIFDQLDAEFHFTLDVCATRENAKCPRFFTRAENGLALQWDGTCWMNPPYGRDIAPWIRKAREAASQGCTVVCLLPASTDTAWWHDDVMLGEVRFIRGRLYFEHGSKSGRAPFPSAIVIFRPDA